MTTTDDNISRAMSCGAYQRQDFSSGVAQPSMRFTLPQLDAYTAQAAQSKAEPNHGIKAGESMDEAAEGWAQWCEARGNQMLANFLRKQAAKIKDAVPLSDERIIEIQSQTIRSWQSSDKCTDGWRMLARAIEAEHGITASKGAA